MVRKAFGKHYRTGQIDFEMSQEAGSLQSRALRGRDGARLLRLIVGDRGPGGNPLLDSLHRPGGDAVQAEGAALAAQVAEGLQVGFAEAAAEGADRLENPLGSVMGGVEVSDAHGASGGRRGEGVAESGARHRGKK